jgi:acetylornithine deacetylase/succinyl-diaminopimelate desuccinylase-like protein
VRQPEVLAALRRCMGVYMPEAAQDADGQVSITLGAKGIVECEMVSSGERWGRGPKHDVHSSLKAALDSPAWHLVEALATLVSPDGNTIMIEGYTKKVRPLSTAERQMIAKKVLTTDEAKLKSQYGVEHWMHDVSLEEAMVRLASAPTINIEGLVAGYTGQGGKTILPHRAVAKLDLRLVPDMTAAESYELLKAHLAKHGFGDIEVNMTGGYDPTTTSQEAGIIQAQEAVYRQNNIQPSLSPRGGGSWPGFVFTGDPLRLAAGHFGLGYGTGAHAPNEFYVIESNNPKVQGIDGAARSQVEYLYQLART